MNQYISGNLNVFPMNELSVVVYGVVIISDRESLDRLNK